MGAGHGEWGRAVVPGSGVVAGGSCGPGGWSSGSGRVGVGVVASRLRVSTDDHVGRCPRAIDLLHTCTRSTLDREGPAHDHHRNPYPRPRQVCALAAAVRDGEREPRAARAAGRLLHRIDSAYGLAPLTAQRYPGRPRRRLRPSSSRCERTSATLTASWQPAP